MAIDIQTVVFNQSNNFSILYHPHPQADRDRVQEIKTWWQDHFGRVQVKLEELNEDFVVKDRLATLHVRVVDHVWPTHSEVVLRVSDETPCPLVTRAMRVSTANSHEFSFSWLKDRLAVDIFLAPEDKDLAKVARAGRTVVLSGVAVEKDDLFKDAYKLKIIKAVGSCQVVARGGDTQDTVEDSMDVLMRQLPSQDLLDTSTTSAGSSDKQQPATVVNPEAINEVFSEVVQEGLEPRVTRSKAKAPPAPSRAKAAKEGTSKRPAGESNSAESGQEVEIISPPQNKKSNKATTKVPKEAKRTKGKKK